MKDLGNRMSVPDSSLALRMTEKDAQNDRKGVDHNIRKIKNVIRDISETHIKNTQNIKKEKNFCEDSEKPAHWGLT